MESPSRATIQSIGDADGRTETTGTGTGSPSKLQTRRTTDSRAYYTTESTSPGSTSRDPGGSLVSPERVLAGRTSSTATHSASVDSPADAAAAASAAAAATLLHPSRGPNVPPPGPVRQPSAGSRVPRPKFHSFALTSSNGVVSHGHCLIYYERLDAKVRTTCLYFIVLQSKSIHFSRLRRRCGGSGRRPSTPSCSAAPHARPCFNTPSLALVWY